jgi:hypothetical protein
MSALYDHNDPEMVDAMKYLILPPEEKIKLQAQPFDGKKACWAPDAKESYVAGEIVGTKGDDITVKTAKGEVNSCSMSILGSIVVLVI